MTIPIIQIGNSKGIRLPKTLLKKYNITDVMEIILKEDHLILKPVKNPRGGWDKAFKKMHEEGEDELLIPDVFEDENIEE